MPTTKQQKVDSVAEIADMLSRCTIAVTTGYQGLDASQMTELRRSLRELGVEYKVIKNTLALRAAESIGRKGIDGILNGSTGVAFGYDDVTSVAKGVDGFITTTRLPLVIYGALMDESILSAEQVRSLAAITSREDLISRLIGQIQSPISRLVNVLNRPIAALAIALNSIVEQRQTGSTAVSEMSSGDGSEVVVTEAIVEASGQSEADVDVETTEENTSDDVSDAAETDVESDSSEDESSEDSQEESPTQE